MQRFSAASAVIAAFLCVTLSIFPAATQAHNITGILAKHPEFSTFNHYLTETHLAAEINRRETITVCAVDNSAMDDLLGKNLSMNSIKNVLSLHVLLDYFGAKKLHQITNGTALVATLFQATGSAPGSSGLLNITDLEGGKVGFWPKDTGGSKPTTYIKSIKEIPYNISVIQISRILPSPEAEAPAPGPAEMNLTSLISSHGCKKFAEALLASSAEKTFENSVNGGLTIFCPGDDAMKKFLPKFNNLTVKGKQSLLEFHGVPVYYSLSDLKSNNGRMNTLATGEGNSDFAFRVQNVGDVVTLETKIVVANVTATLFDENPLAIFTLDKVLEPKELFKAVDSPTPAPAPAPEAHAKPPKSGKKPKLAPAPEAPSESPSDSPADAPSGDDDDQSDDDSGAFRFSGGRFLILVFSLCVALFT